LAEELDLLVIAGDQYSDELSLTAKESAGQYEHVLFGIEKLTEIVDCSDLLIKAAHINTDCGVDGAR